MKRIFWPVFLLLFSLLASCKKDTPTEPENDSNGKIDVVISDVPFPTEKYLRIPYTLKVWEYEKEGLKLRQIIVLDEKTQAELMVINKDDLPIIYKNPLASNPYFTPDQLSHYYLSVQVPVPLSTPKSERIYHKFILTDSVLNKEVVVSGGSFAPLYGQSPFQIASPLKGENMVFFNQSSLEYHFYVLFFTGGKIYNGERFAFDYLKVDQAYETMFTGDPAKNSSYFNYRDTLYAVAGGTVKTIKDGRAENNGNRADVPIKSADELGGNYLVLDIGSGRYAFYAHCVPGSFMVKEGQKVSEGDPIALVGNSGNSDAPHLHFEITDGPDILFSRGLPFVLKNYIKTGEMETGPVAPLNVYNSMMEQNTVVKVN